jgi:hypothetical protein
VFRVRDVLDHSPLIQSSEVTHYISGQALLFPLADPYLTATLPSYVTASTEAEVVEVGWQISSRQVRVT